MNLYRYLSEEVVRFVARENDLCPIHCCWFKHETRDFKAFMHAYRHTDR